MGYYLCIEISYFKFHVDNVRIDSNLIPNIHTLLIIYHILITIKITLLMVTRIILNQIIPFQIINIPIKSILIQIAMIILALILYNKGRIPT